MKNNYYLAEVEVAPEFLPDEPERTISVIVKLTEEMRQKRIERYEGMELEQRIQFEKGLASMDAREFVKENFPQYKSVIVMPDTRIIIKEDRWDDLPQHVFELKHTR